jgi:UDP:flavonoid glycosyltransferase YjiC (YdhE family)
MLTVGSRGDVQPFVALAARLREGGHDAVLAAPALFADLAAAHSIPFVPLDLDPVVYLGFGSMPVPDPKPLAAALVAGVGQVGARAVLAGRPQVIWPFGIDQPFWSRRMASLGVAPPPLLVRALTADTLGGALNRALGDRDMAGRAGRPRRPGQGRAGARMTVDA